LGWECATTQHYRTGSNAPNQIGPQATAACVKFCELDYSLATHGAVLHAINFSFHQSPQSETFPTRISVPKTFS